MLANFNYLLKDAVEKDYGVGIMEVWDLHTIKAGVEAAVEENSPAAILAGQTFIEGIGVEQFADISLSYINSVEVPIALCLDECRDFEFIIQCIKHGFSFVMFDGASSELEKTEALSLEDNIEITRNIVKIAHSVNVTVEASLGEMPLSSGGKLNQMQITGKLTDPDQAYYFVENTGIDILAPSIGNIHCLYAEKWPEPDWKLAEKIVKKAGIPCALHGASGAKDEQIRKAISIGFRKINIGTRYNEIYRKALIEELQRCEGLGCPYNSSIKAGDEFKKEAKRLMREVYRSSNRFRPTNRDYWVMERLKLSRDNRNKALIDEITRSVLDQLN